MRAGSRSPRRGDEEELDTEAAQGYVARHDPEVPEWEGAGLPPPSQSGPSSLAGQLRSQRDFLEQFTRQNPLAVPEPAPREFAAGLPLEAARALLLRPGSEGWHHNHGMVCLPTPLVLLQHQGFSPRCYLSRLKTSFAGDYVRRQHQEARLTRSQHLPRSLRVLTPGSSWPTPCYRPPRACRQWYAMSRWLAARCSTIMSPY